MFTLRDEGRQVLVLPFSIEELRIIPVPSKGLPNVGRIEIKHRHCQEVLLENDARKRKDSEESCNSDGSRDNEAKGNQYQLRCKRRTQQGAYPPSARTLFGMSFAKVSKPVAAMASVSCVAANSISQVTP